MARKRWKSWIGFVCGFVLVGGGLIGAYWWFYKLVPVKRLGDRDWVEAHSARAIWEMEQAKYRRLGTSPDLMWAHDKIGFYGDEQWCQWLIERMSSGDDDFRVCGCTYTVLMLMTNANPEGEWGDWWDAHGLKTQEEWMQLGFAEYGVDVALPVTGSFSRELLELLGREPAPDLAFRERVRDTERHGAAPAHLWEEERSAALGTVVPYFLRYNAFRWLRDSGFEPSVLRFDYPELLEVAEVRRGLIAYAEMNGEFPRTDGIGLLDVWQNNHRELAGYPEPWTREMIGMGLVALVLGGLLLAVRGRPRMMARRRN